MLNLDQQNRLREQYRQMNPSWRPATETYAALVRTYLDPTSRVLDLGCGRGGLVEQLNHPQSQITGVDPDWLSLAEHRLESMGRAAAASASLPFRRASYDLVLASWLFEHLSQPARTLQEVHRVLKPGGVIIFITPNGRHPVAYLNRLLGQLEGLQSLIVKELYGREQEDTFPTTYRANTEEQLAMLARQSGLAQITLAPIPDPTYLAFSAELFRLACLFEDNLPQSRYIHLVGVLKRPE